MPSTGVSDGKSADISSDGSVIITGDSVQFCSEDNTLTKTLNTCSNSENINLSSYDESVTGDIRCINVVNFPNHDYGSPTQLIEAENSTWSIDATPELNSSDSVTWLFDGEDGPLGGGLRYRLGVALNGVLLAPTAAFPYENNETGEVNWDWVLEATTNTGVTTLDCNQAHLQATTYHYHGDPVKFAEVSGIDVSSPAMKQVGWAADGFPIYYKYAYNTSNDTSSGARSMISSYQLKAGEREGDAISAPCGEYNGKYQQDYEFVEGLGDLDQCNGRTGVTPEFPDGTYYYVITNEMADPTHPPYPILPRCLSGIPNDSFRTGHSTLSASCSAN